MLDLFGNEIIERKIIDRTILENVLIASMRGITEKELVSMIYSKYEAIGEKISMIFNPHRYSTKTKVSKSIVSGFNDESFLSGLARATIFKHGKVKELLYQVLQLGINGVQYVNEFPPKVARDLYSAYNAKRIIDPCAGWGGRMIGAASIGSFYHGFEPATKTYTGLNELGNFLKSFKNGFDFLVENIPFEDAVLTENYDFGLTSPPYFDTEHYADEETNSFNRYKTFSNWCDGFYLPMIAKTVKHTQSFILNVGSREYDLKAVMMKQYPNTIEIDNKLSGGGGFGRKRNGQESFYLVKE